MCADFLTLSCAENDDSFPTEATMNSLLHFLHLAGVIRHLLHGQPILQRMLPARLLKD